MSALTKKPVPLTRTVFEMRTTAGTDIRNMTITEAADQGYGSEVRIAIDKSWDADQYASGRITLTDTEQLDGLIQALIELRETYQ